MVHTARDTEQRYWRHDALPHIELRSTRDSRLCYKAHSHPTMSIGAIESGRTRLLSGGEATLLKAGDLVLIEPQRVHACNPVAGGPRGYHMLYVDPRWCLSRLAALYGRPVDAMVGDQQVIRAPTLYRRYREVVQAIETAPSTASCVRMDELVRHILERYCSPGPAPRVGDDIPCRVKRQLLKELIRPPSLEELAATFECSTEALIRSFRRRFGITPRAFVNNARIDRAKSLLRAGQPAVEVALALGFADQSQFHRTFVLYTASTPRQYQRAGSISDNIRS